MLELDRLPGRLLLATIIFLCPGRGVTGSAFFAITASMAIIQTVAGIAVTRCLFPALIRMAKTAGNFFMNTLQFEFGLFMFESGY